MNVLFVCSQNKWRSPTGEKVFMRYNGVATRSAGTSRNARRTITVTDIRWADLILVMEHKHASRIRADYRNETTHKDIHILDIPDDYMYMDPELVVLITEASEPLIVAALQA